jgi:hypothetical protein
MPKIFISYRREDSPYEAVAIRDRLAARFGKREIFFDVDTIPLGHNFRDVIDRKVAACDYCIALIGRSWLSANDEDGCRRLDDPNDFVRLEIEAALKRKIPVIAVLLHNVRMPKADQLPLPLKELAERQGIAVRPLDDFNRDVERLMSGIDEQERERGEDDDHGSAPAVQPIVESVGHRSQPRDAGFSPKKDPRPKVRRLTKPAFSWIRSLANRVHRLRQPQPQSATDQRQANSSTEARAIHPFRSWLEFIVLVACILDVPLAWIFIIAGDVKTIVISGPLMVALGVGLLCLSRRRRRLVAVAAAQIVIPVSIGLPIIVKEWGPAQVDTPLKYIGVACLLVTVPLGIWALVDLLRSRDSATHQPHAQSEFEKRAIDPLRLQLEIVVLVACILDAPLAWICDVAIDLATVTISGPAAVALGVGLLCLSRRRRRLVAVAAAQIVIPVSIYLLMLLNDWGRARNERLMPYLIVASLFVTVPLGIWALVDLLRTVRAAGEDVA